MRGNRGGGGSRGLGKRMEGEIEKSVGEKMRQTNRRRDDEDKPLN